MPVRNTARHPEIYLTSTFVPVFFEPLDLLLLWSQATAVIHDPEPTLEIHHDATEIDAAMELV